jgi:facilitated trehalose transporter
MPCSHLGQKIGWKPLYYGFLLLFIADFCGAYALMIYSTLIFNEIGSSLSPHASALVLYVWQIVGSFLATLLIDRVGRKILLVISCFGGIVGYLAVAAYVYCKNHQVDLSLDMEGLEWIPLVSLSLTVFLQGLGIASIALLYVAEVTPQKAS